MVFPNSSSERGISEYSLDLIRSLKKQGMNIEEATFTRGNPLTLFKKLSDIIKSDLIHIQHEYNLLGFYGLPYFFLFFYLWLFKKKALITTMHTVPSLKIKFIGSKVKNFLRKLFYRCQNRWIRRSSDKIIVHTKSFKKILTEEYSFPESKIIVLPHAIKENIKIIPKKEAKKELNLTGNVYLLIGTMVPDHGHDIILKQADKIGKTILIATNPTSANPSYEEKIKEFLKLNQEIVKENHFEKFVRFDIGPISYEKWWKYFSASDLILLPYKGGIGSGIFADAMAVKKPVIASNVIYFKDFAEDYGCIKLAESDENFPEIIRESMNPKNYKKMLDECNRYFKENNLTKISQKYKELYNSILS